MVWGFFVGTSQLYFPFFSFCHPSPTQTTTMNKHIPWLMKENLRTFLLQRRISRRSHLSPFFVSILLFLVVTPVLFVVTTASSTTSTNVPSSYTSVRALDQFGHSVQLKHAREAAQKHGRFVVAGQSINNETVVISIGTKPMVHLASLTTIANVDHKKKQLENHDDDDDDEVSAATTTKFEVVAVCCTGVKGDATWIINEIQKHCMNVWDRYNHHLDAPAVAHVMSRLLGSFGGEDIDQEWQSNVGRIKSEWARPLGIQTMILSQHTPILIVEPSGRVLTTPPLVGVGGEGGGSSSGRSRRMNNRVQIGVLGKDSNLVLDNLRRRMMEESTELMETAKLREFLLDIMMKQVVPTDGTINILVEILSKTGIERTSIQVVNGKQILL